MLKYIVSSYSVNSKCRHYIIYALSEDIQKFNIPLVVSAEFTIEVYHIAQ